MFATVTTNSTGLASFIVYTPSAVPLGQFIAATATDPAGNTSEFSADITITAMGGTTRSFIVTNLNDSGSGSLRQGLDRCEQRPDLVRA